MSTVPTTHTSLHQLVRAVLVGGLASLVVAAAWWWVGPHLGWPAVLLVMVLVAVGDVAEVSLRLGEHRVRFSSGEAVLLLGFAAGSPPAVVVLAALVLSVGELVRRQRSLMKAAYNVASATVAAMLGAFVVAVGGASQPGPRSWPALAAAAAVVVVTQGLLVSAAVARSTGTGTWEVFARGHAHRVLLWAANVLLAIAVLAAWTWNRSVIVAIALAALSGSSLVARLMRTRDELDGLRRLDLATRTLPGLDETEVLTSVCHQACALLGLDGAEIVLADTVSPDDRAARGFVFRAAPGSAPSRRPLRPEDRQDLAATAGAGVHSRVSEGHLVSLASLRAGDSHVGLLRVVLPGSQPDGPEHHLLAALATTAGGAVLNARMYAAQTRHAEELRETAEREYRQARRDPLTGLGNRTGLLEQGDVALADRREHLGLLLLDLDHFKQVNDTLGHAAGDELLRRVGRRLSEHAGPSAYLARLSGDAFAILVPTTGRCALEELGHRLLERLKEPIMVDGLRLTAEATIGVAWAPEHATRMDELLRCADMAMYRAKSTNQSLLAYDEQRDDDAVERLQVLAAVQAALVRGEIVVHYQPKVDLDTGEVTGVEALCRWQHPELGLLPPARFMTVVEHSSVINELTHHVLREAAAAAVRFGQSGRPISVAVNVSPRCLLDASFASEVATTLHETGLPPERLVVEITETLALVELDTVETVLAELRRLGVRLSVDDFGTGYSSLTFLQRVDVHEVKIDRSFVMQMHERPGALAIVEATIGLAHRLGLVAIAEGVELGAQVEMLRAAGCDQVQGYLVARPMPEHELVHWLRTERARKDAKVIPFQRESDHEVTA